MDTTLVMVTLLSLGMAGALSVIVWRMLRDDRQRSDARVAALATLAGRPEPAPLHGAPLRSGAGASAGRAASRGGRGGAAGRRPGPADSRRAHARGCERARAGDG